MRSEAVAYSARQLTLVNTETSGRYPHWNQFQPNNSSDLKMSMIQPGALSMTLLGGNVKSGNR
jgi:hypothetical protein